MAAQFPKVRRRTVEEDVIIRELSEEERLQNAVNSTDDEDNDPDEDDEVLFTIKMRQATRKVHNVSDALVNAKLGIAMSDEKVWAEGLLVFYEIFRFLENALERLAPRNSHFKKMHAVIQDIQRTKAFEDDLQYYYGNNYLKTYQIRPSVADYLKHLETLEEREPLRLLAYVYHLYMGLLSGGQILKRKRELRRKLKRSFGELLGWFGLRPQGSTTDSYGSSSSKPGNAVTTFAMDGRTISDIKKEIAFTMNDIAADLSRDEKESLLSEGIAVFQRNNEIVGSIERTGLIALKNLTGSPVIWLVALVAIGTFCMYWYFSEASPPPLSLPVPISPPPADSIDLNPVDTEFEIGADGFLQ
ncbi:Heme oxygenase 1 [Orchesella cincta]|uniref:Heme oxygenase 1 n=1 Tax=Orchesella cincta TaxID=48709 RepID=A0A1D2MRU4_ORCCI|nr:Heme oxygenase 1 [Orchesella cincta]